MTIEINLEQLFRDALADYLEKHPITLQEPAPQTEPETPRFLSRKEAADIGRMSLPKLHELINTGLVHPVKNGRRTLIPADEFLNDLAAGRFKRNRA